MQQPIFLELFVTVARDKIAILKFILEGYDGLASLSTVDNRKGLLVLRCFPSCREELIDVLVGLSFPISFDVNLENTLKTTGKALI